MPALGLDRELDQLLAEGRANSRYIDLCMSLRRPLVEVWGPPGTRIDPVAEFCAGGAGGVVLRPAQSHEIPAAGRLILPASSSPEAIGASARLPAGVALRAPGLLQAVFQPEEILRAGRSWDRLRACWADHPARAPLVIDLEESQIEFVRWFSGWLRAFREGGFREDSAVLNFGGRRGGKTFACLLCLLAAMIDVPGAIGWAVSVSHVERDVDIDRNFARLLPRSWYTYREQPSHKYTFLHGSTVVNVSADDPEGAKRGQSDVVLINEGAKMARLVFENSLGGTADRAGIVMVATNPPQTTKGEWVEELVSDAEEARARAETPLVRVFRTDHRLNRAIDQAARSRIGRILRKLNPALADADDEGIMRPVGDRALYMFNRALHASQPLPERGGVTEAFTRQKRGRPYLYLLGADFQRRPFIAGTVWQLFEPIEQPHLWCIAAFIVEGNEDDFLDQLHADGHFHAQNTLVIADSTGVTQNYAHENSKTSWGPFFARGWDIIGAQEKRLETSRGPANPRVELSLGQTNRVISEGRFHVTNEIAAQAFKECRAAKGRYGIKATGIHAHLVDTARYVCWWADPPRIAARSQGRLNRRR